jgi:hypothetical protein
VRRAANFINTGSVEEATTEGLVVVRSARRRLEAVWERFEGDGRWLSAPRSTVDATWMGGRDRRPILAVASALRGGGSRTPVAIALAKELAARGLEPILWVRGYRGQPTRAGWVTRGATADAHGDEAVVARASLPEAIAIWRGDWRSAPPRRGRLVVADGLFVGRPTPGVWTLQLAGRSSPTRALAGLHLARSSLMERAMLEGGAGGSIGLLTACARPARVRAALRSLGARPVLHVELGDHEPPSWQTLDRLARVHRLAAWCVDAKAGAWPVATNIAVMRIHHEVRLPPSVLEEATRWLAGTTLDGSDAR